MPFFKNGKPGKHRAKADSPTQDKQPLFSSRARVLLISLVILSFSSAFASAGWEIITMAKTQIMDASGHLTPVKGDQKQRAKPPVHPVHFFPKQVKDYTIFGKQKVRGEEDYAAEAIFKPDSEQYSMVEPLNVYVKISYYASDEEAQKAIDRVMSGRKIVDRVNLDVGVASAGAGYTTDRSTLIVAWVKNGYAVEIDSSYTEVIPAQKTTALEINAQAVGKEIWGKMATEANE